MPEAYHGSAIITGPPASKTIQNQTLEKSTRKEYQPTAHSPPTYQNFRFIKYWTWGTFD